METRHWRSTAVIEWHFDNLIISGSHLQNHMSDPDATSFLDFSPLHGCSGKNRNNPEEVVHSKISL